MPYEIKNLGPGKWFSTEAGKTVDEGATVTVSRLAPGTEAESKGPRKRLEITKVAAPPPPPPVPVVRAKEHYPASTENAKKSAFDDEDELKPDASTKPAETLTSTAKEWDGGPIPSLARGRDKEPTKPIEVKGADDKDTDKPAGRSSET